MAMASGGSGESRGGFAPVPVPAPARARMAAASGSDSLLASISSNRQLKAASTFGNALTEASAGSALRNATVRLRADEEEEESESESDALNLWSDECDGSEQLSEQTALATSIGLGVAGGLTRELFAAGTVLPATASVEFPAPPPVDAHVCIYAGTHLQSRHNALLARLPFSLPALPQGGLITVTLRLPGSGSDRLEVEVSAARQLRPVLLRELRLPSPLPAPAPAPAAVVPNHLARAREGLAALGLPLASTTGAAPLTFLAEATSPNALRVRLEGTAPVYALCRAKTGHHLLGVRTEPHQEVTIYKVHGSDKAGWHVAGLVPMQATLAGVLASVYERRLPAAEHGLAALLPCGDIPAPGETLETNPHPLGVDASSTASGNAALPGTSSRSSSMAVGNAAAVQDLRAVGTVCFWLGGGDGGLLVALQLLKALGWTPAEDVTTLQAVSKAAAKDPAALAQAMARLCTRASAASALLALPAVLVSVCLTSLGSRTAAKLGVGTAAAVEVLLKAYEVSCEGIGCREGRWGRVSGRVRERGREREGEKNGVSGRVFE